MRTYKAPYGNGFYEIGKIDEKWVAIVYDSKDDIEGFQIVEDDYDELCKRIANIYF